MQKSLYEQDYYLWIETTASLLRQRHFNQIDLDLPALERRDSMKNHKDTKDTKFFILVNHSDLILKAFIGRHRFPLY
ncbi:DUF29 family protein [Gloeocapsa sp. PCC 73106]|uniref:DUF29 family protein n=1 Tax=Gloeocapsa sp. PCC 73106 TaxID=102232 RepID=UPI0002ABF19C|nr:DUF29 family protein [Gloeocapsa sp. PCC 73106]ELR97139.1 protein of unknown function DUF29 [Gloeocapsa sp. PCC 73106]